MRASFIALTGLVLLLPACKKEPGEGGKAEIKGIVLRQEMNAAGAPVGDPYPYQEARVYIVYGDHDFYDDDVRTGPEGQFSFSWLRKGSYTVYTFSECQDCPEGSVALTSTVQIDDKKGTVIVPTFTAANY